MSHKIHQARFFEQIAIMFGREPKKPTVISPAAEQIHELKRMANKVEVRAAIMAAHERPHGNTWRNRRWAFLIATNLLFVLSFWLDIQILEGALTASRLIGFHLIDVNSALQVMLAHKHIIVNLVIGTSTVAAVWMLLGGRTFCSWVCPYHFLAEWAEKLHLWMAKKRLVSDQPMSRGLRTWFWAIFALAALGTGYTGV
jgi:ferredoxin-type protein NapH